MTRISEDAGEQILRTAVKEAIEYGEGKRDRVRTVEEIIEDEDLALPTHEEHWSTAHEVVEENKEKLEQLFVDGKVDQILNYLVGQAKRKNPTLDAKEVREMICSHIWIQAKAEMLKASWKRDDIHVDWEEDSMQYTPETFEEVIAAA